MLLSFAIVFAVPLFAATPGEVAREFLYESAPFPSVHASTIVETKAGLVAAYFGGKAEGDLSVGIWVQRKIEDQWSDPQEVANGLEADGKRFPCWNPVLFQPKIGPLLLFYKVGPKPNQWWGMLRTSDDHGATWSEATKLPAGILGPIKNKPIELADGTLLCPTSTESNDGKDQWRVRFELTRDLGKTWESTVPQSQEKEIDAIQPSILVHPAGVMQAVGRTRAKRVFQTWSHDHGKTWSALALLDLPNPNAGTDAITLRDGRHLLVYNHTEKGRSPLNLALSNDGKTWSNIAALETEKGEYSYPAVIQAADGLVHITYTWNRRKVAHVTLDPAKWVLEK